MNDFMRFSDFIVIAVVIVIIIALDIAIVRIIGSHHVDIDNGWRWKRDGRGRRG